VPTTPPISVQLYSLREEAKTDFAPVIERLGRAGFVGVELAGFNNLTPSEFAAVAADSGLVVSSAHVGDLTPDALNATLDDLQLVGCDTAIAAFLPPTSFESLDAVKQSAELINAAHAIAAQRGMTFGYHNHWWEFENQFDGKSAWTHLFNQLDPAVFAELDLYWAIVGGADPRAVIASVGDRVQFLHVKDGPADDPKHAMVAVGSGVVDIAGALGAAPSARWHVVELDRCDTDMFEAVEGSYRYLVGRGLSTGRV
jgi:sugar phosphate isomerase/epimerase